MIKYYFIHVDGLDLGKKTEIKIGQLAKIEDGKCDGLTDKGAIFKFETKVNADTFCMKLRSIGVSTTEIE